MRRIEYIWIRIGMFLDSFEEIPCLFYTIGIMTMFVYAVYDLICEIFGIRSVSIGSIFWG